MVTRTRVGVKAARPGGSLARTGVLCRAMSKRDPQSRRGFARRLAAAAWLVLVLGTAEVPSGATHASPLAQDAPERITRAEIHDLI